MTFDLAGEQVPGALRLASHRAPGHAAARASSRVERSELRALDEVGPLFRCEDENRTVGIFGVAHEHKLHEGNFNAAASAITCGPEFRLDAIADRDHLEFLSVSLGSRCSRRQNQEFTGNHARYPGRDLAIGLAVSWVAARLQDRLRVSMWAVPIPAPTSVSVEA
jgi:hypothetical protein